MITHQSKRGRRSRRALLACSFVVIAAPSGAQVRADHGRHTRLQRFARDMAFGTVEGLALAGVDQARNRPLEWGTGTAGYGRRAASNVGEFVIQDSVTEGLAAALKHPLDYTRCRCGNISENRACITRSGRRRRARRSLCIRATENRRSVQRRLGAG